MSELEKSPQKDKLNLLSRRDVIPPEVLEEFKFTIRPRFAYSAREPSPKSMVYLTENHIAFPIGRHLWKYHVKKKDMVFLARRTQAVEPLLCVSKNRKRLLVAESVVEGMKKAFLQLIDITLKTPVVLWKFQHLAKGAVNAIDISADGEVVVAHATYDDEKESKTGFGFIVLWKTETKKFVASKELTTPIKYITISPDDNYLICVSGEGYLRFLKCVGNTLDEIPMLRRHHEKAFTFLQQAWISVDCMACLTEQGVLCLFEKGELKQKITPEGTDGQLPNRACCIVGYQDGFIVGTDAGTLMFYQSVKGEPYVMLKEIFTGCRSEVTDLIVSPSGESILLSIKNHAVLQFPLGQFGWSQKQHLPFVPALSPCGNTIAMTASAQKSYLLTLGEDKTLRCWNGMRESRQLVSVSFSHSFEEEPLALALHPGGFGLVVVFAKTCCVYHIVRDGLKLSHTFSLLAPIFKPVVAEFSHRGDRVAICTSGNIFIFNSLEYVMRQHVIVSKPIEACRWSTNDTVLVASSLDGSVYAWELNGLTRLQDFSDKSILFSSLVVDWGRRWEWQEDLCSPIKRVHKLVFHSQHDAPTSALVRSKSKNSGSENGGVGANENLENASENELDCEARGIIIAAGIAPGNGEASRFVYLSEDGVPRDLRVWQDSSFSKTGDATEMKKLQITCMTLDKARHVLIAGTQKGAILLIHWPLRPQDDRKRTFSATCYAQYMVHFGSVEGLHLDPEVGVLYSRGSDGTLFVLDLGLISQTGFAMVPLHKEMTTTDDKENWVEEPYRGDVDLVMVKGSEIEKTLVASENHAQKLAQLKDHLEYQLRTAKDRYEEQLAILKSDMEQAVDKKTKEADVQNAAVHQLKVQIKSKDRENQEALEKSQFNLRDSFETKLQQQIAQAEATQKAFQKKLNDLTDDCSREKERAESRIKELETLLQQRDHEFKKNLEEMRDENEKLEAHYEEALWQADIEHDLEVKRVKEDCDVEIMKTKQGTAMVLAEMSGMKTEMEEKKTQFNHLRLQAEEQEQKLEQKQELLTTLKDGVESLKKKQKAKEIELFQRSQQLATTRQGTAVLHNFASVLEARISELEGKEEPMQDYLKQMKTTMASMNDEMFKQTAELNQQKHLMAEKTAENNRLTASVKRLRQEAMQKNKRWRTVAKEVQHIVENTPPAEWPEAIQFFYSAYIASSVKGDDNDDGGREVHNRVFAVLDRQRRYLENSMENMKNTMGVLEKRRQNEAEKFIQRNTLFLAEVNQLREQNRKLEQRCKKYMRMALVSNEMSKRLAAPDQASKDGLRKPLLPNEAKSPSQLTLDPNELAPSDGEVLWEHRPRTGATLKPGTLMKGSTRPLTAVAELKQELQETRQALEQAQTTVELQKLEISHLQEGVTVALDLAQTNFATYSGAAPSGGGEIDFTLSPGTPLRSPSGMLKLTSRPITPGSTFPIPEHSQTPPGLGSRAASANGGKRGMRVSQSAQTLKTVTSNAAQLLNPGSLSVPASSQGSGQLPRTPTKVGSVSSPKTPVSLKMTPLYSGKRPV
jgi:WD40 repeat protein